MSSANLAPCPDCGHAVSRLAETCPNCGRLLRRPEPREGLYLRTMNQLVSASIWVFLFLLIVPLIGALVGIFLARH